MEHFGATATGYSDRNDLIEAHRRAWQRIAQAGTWWTGEERVALAAATRGAPQCALCSERSGALSPNAVQGQHDHDGQLSDALVDVVHRITVDNQRLSKEWFEEVVSRDLSIEQYVELVGVLTQTLSIDTLHYGLGLDLEALPKPQAGEPSRRRPSEARDDGAWVPMLSERGLAPEDADLFSGLPKTGTVLRALSLVPNEVRALCDLSAAQYLKDTDVADPKAGSHKTLTRPQIELLAARVSALNECFY